MAGQSGLTLLPSLHMRMNMRPFALSAFRRSECANGDCLSLTKRIE